MSLRWIIGLACGSSGDGVDAVLLEVDGVGLALRVRLQHAMHQPFGRELRDQLRRLTGQPRQASLPVVGVLHRVLGEACAAAARQVADQASLTLPQVQCIGCPGHTAWMDVEGRFPSGLEVGMAAVVAERTGVTIISDFRSRDLAVGGQGVPLAALADFLLFRSSEEDRVLLHLGGLARVVWLPASGRVPEVLGFEAGPCGVLLDTLTQHLTNGRETFDAGGKHAVQGRCLEEPLQQWLAHPYFQRRPPKSLPRHEFREEFVAHVLQQARQQNWRLHDLMCTAAHFVVDAIADSLKRFLPDGQRPARVLLGGGGVRNGLLWQLLDQRLDGVPLERTDRLGIPPEIRKAVTSGILAALLVDGVPASVPSATGAAGSRLLGSVTPGSPSNWARCLAWMASHTAQYRDGPNGTERMDW